MGLRLLALACLAGAAFAGPLQREGQNECAKECHPSSYPKFGWKVGRADVYHFKSGNEITYAGSQPQKSSVEGTLEYHTISPCQAVLKMRNIRINQKLTPEEKEDMKEKLEIPLTFTRNDGIVEHICPSLEESTQSLNIKKAMISSFINSMSDLDSPEETETYESLGKCKTQYTPTKISNGVVITKEVDLQSCTNKHTVIVPFLTTQIRSSLIFEKSHLRCTQHIEDQIIKRIECNETERMKPPVKEKNSWFELSSKLRITHLENKPAELFYSNENRPQEDILYGIEETRKGDNNDKEVEKILKRMCAENFHVVHINVSRDFIQLGQLAKNLPYEKLDEIYNSLSYGKICSSKKVRDIFVDTLPMIGNEAAVKLMVKLIENRYVRGLKAKLWPTSFALIRKPTKAMISAIIPLVERDYSLPVVLGVSAMIHRLCTTEDCTRVDPVNRVVSLFNDYIGEKCSSDDEDKAMAALKAFGNMGYHGKAHKNILACIQDNSKPTRLRLAAIDSFRRINQKRPDEIVKVYSDKDEVHELRIAAFESVSKYVDHEQYLKIKQTAERENNTQVGAFVSSYIKNLKKTTCPSKQKTKALLQNIQTPRFNYWENSKKIEVSGHSKALNMGGGLEVNVINSLESKIPRSISALFTVDVYGKQVNLFEIGVTAGGFERVIEKMVGLKNSLPKEQSWSLFSPSHLFGDTDAELSFFTRLIDTEILAASGSDLSRMGEMVRIAEMMNTLAQGKNADLSHSFVFMNSKLVVPSVTGRSYSIDFTGSSTVGVTAKSKVDILSFPRNADVHLQLQSSMNTEIATTVGIHSNKQRPDVKILSRIHLESNVETKFYVKDGHVAIASVTLPSENIMQAKLSTNIVNIDERHNEKRIYEKMQKKVDFCFTKLHKPLGISACTTIEVPKPMVTESFPYWIPFWNGEFTLKKSDGSFNSYEMRYEMPKHSGPEMKYKVALDTPGSKIPRRFAAGLNLKQRKNQKEFSAEFTSPFKNAGISGSILKNGESIQAKLEIHSDSKKMISANFTSKMHSSKSRIMKEFSAFAWREDSGRPLNIVGRLTAITGRKIHKSFYLKMSKPESKPITVTGTITQEGNVDLSSGSEWKLSTEFAVNSSIGDMKIWNTCDKKSKKIQAISADLGIDYQKMGGKRHRATLSGTSQRSSKKINTNARFETTEYPATNWHLNWDMQRDSEDVTNNNLTLKYGKEPEKNYINLKQTSRVPELGSGENTVSVEIPQLNLDYGFSVKHNLELGETPKFQVNADVRYNRDKHVKGLIDLNYQTTGPLNATGKFEFEHNGVHYIYEDEIVERSDKVIEGKSKLQYEEGKVIQLDYIVKSLSDDSKFHHEIESSLKTPSSASPIESKVSLRMSSESIAFAGRIGSKYSIQALSNQVETRVHVKHPSLEGNLAVNNEVEKKNISLDMRIKGNYPRHAIGSLVIENSENTRRYHMEIISIKNNQTESKLLAHTELEILSAGEAYSSSSQFQILNENETFVDIYLNETGDLSAFGDHACTFRYVAENLNPIQFQLKRKIGSEISNTLAILSINDIDVATMQLNSRSKKEANKHELSLNGNITSLYRPHKYIDVHLSQTVTRSGASTIFVQQLYLRKNHKVYAAEWSSDLQSNGVELNAAIQTPHENYEKQALGISIQRATDGISSSMNIESPNSKVISIKTEIKKKENGVSIYVNVNTPIKEIKKIRFNMIAHNQGSKRTWESTVAVNNATLVEMQGKIESTSRGTEAEGKIKTFSRYIEYKEVGMNFRSTKEFISALGNVEYTNNKKLSFNIEIKKKGDLVSTTTTISAPHKHWKNCKIHLSVENQPYKRSLACYIETNRERNYDAELSLASSAQGTEMKGRLKTSHTPEMSAHVKCQQTGESLAAFANIVKGKSPIFSTSFNRLSHSRGETLSINTRKYGKTLFDLEVLKDESRRNSKKYSFKVSRESRAVSATFLKSEDDPTSMRTELRVCQEAHQTECYSLKSFHKNVLNHDNHRFYQNHTMKLEKSVGKSYPESVGNLQIVVHQDQYDSRSKFILQTKDQKIGYEMELHRRQHQDDHHSLDTRVFLPQRTSNLRISLLHNINRVQLEFDAIPNAEDPSRKFGIDIRRYINPESKEVSGYIKVDHPTRSEPLLFTCKLEQVDDTFVKGKMLLHYSTTYGKTLIFELKPNLEHEQNAIRSMIFKLYTQDKSLDTHLKLIKEKSKGVDKIGYEWKYASEGDEKTGGVIATFYDKKDGNPKSMKIKYYSPSNDYEVQGTIAQAPEDASVSLVSRGQIMKELHIKTSDSCLNIEIHNSEPLLKSSLCVNKREGDIIQLMTAEVYCPHEKCVDARLYVDPQKPGFVSVGLRWRKRDIFRSLRKATDYDEIFQGRSLRKFYREWKNKVAIAGRDFLSTTKDKLRRVMNKSEEEIYKLWKRIPSWRSEELDEHMQSPTRFVKSLVTFGVDLLPVEYISQEVLRPLHEATRCFSHEYVQLVWKHIPQFLSLIADVTKTQYVHCLKKFCVQGTFCHEFFLISQQNGILAAQDLVYSRISQGFLKFPTIRGITLADIFKILHWPIEFLNGTLAVFFRILRRPIDYILNSTLAVFYWILSWPIALLNGIVDNIFKIIHIPIDFVKGELENAFGKFMGDKIFGTLWKKVGDLVKAFENRLRKRVNNFLDKIFDRINEIFNGDEDYRIAKSLATDAKRKITNAWRNREQIVKRSIQALKNDIKEDAKKIIQEQIQVEKFDPKGGDVRFSFRQPFGPAEIQILKNELRAISHKIEEYLRH